MTPEELPPDPDELGLIPEADAYPTDQDAADAVALAAWRQFQTEQPRGELR